VSPHLRSLTHIALTGLGDESCRALAASGLPGRLKSLSLTQCGMTDGAAAELAACPGVGRLERLNVSGNMLTAEGIEVLRRTDVLLVNDGQFGLIDPDDSGEFDAMLGGEQPG
jgi:hypothetical protein